MILVDQLRVMGQTREYYRDRGCQAADEIERLEGLIPARPENAAYLVWMLKPVKGEPLPYNRDQGEPVEGVG